MIRDFAKVVTALGGAPGVSRGKMFGSEGLKAGATTVRHERQFRSPRHPSRLWGDSAPLISHHAFGGRRRGLPDSRRAPASAGHAYTLGRRIATRRRFGPH
jgi:hypothetical protein